MYRRRANCLGLRAHEDWADVGESRAIEIGRVRVGERPPPAWLVDGLQKVGGRRPSVGCRVPSCCLRARHHIDLEPVQSAHRHREINIPVGWRIGDSSDTIHCTCTRTRTFGMALTLLPTMPRKQTPAREFGKKLMTLRTARITRGSPCAARCRHQDHAAHHFVR